jgi:L-lysine exporter family protein LysE/ArgO
LNAVPAAVASGFLLGLGLIVAIGAQNAYVLRLGLKRQHVFAICLACSLADALLIVAGVAGLGTWISRSPDLIRWVTIAGALFLTAYGFMAARRVMKTETLAPSQESETGLKGALATGLAFTFLNPHVYLDTVVLVGGLSAAYAGLARAGFAAGAAMASFVWFFGLGYGARLLIPIFSRPASWRILDGFVAIVMWTLAATLLIGLSGN